MNMNYKKAVELFVPLHLRKINQIILYMEESGTLFITVNFSRDNFSDFIEMTLYELNKFFVIALTSDI